MTPVSYQKYGGRKATVTPHGLGEDTDAWGRPAGEGHCEAWQPGGRTTWFLCRNQPVKAIGVQRDGKARYLCGRHVGAAKRARKRQYSDTIVALCTLDGEQTHEWLDGAGLTEIDV